MDNLPAILICNFPTNTVEFKYAHKSDTSCRIYRECAYMPGVKRTKNVVHHPSSKIKDTDGVIHPY